MHAMYLATRRDGSCGGLIVASDLFPFLFPFLLFIGIIPLWLNELSRFIKYYYYKIKSVVIR